MTVPSLNLDSSLLLQLQLLETVKSSSLPLFSQQPNQLFPVSFPCGMPTHVYAGRSGSQIGGLPLGSPPSSLKRQAQEDISSGYVEQKKQKPDTEEDKTRRRKEKKSLRERARRELLNGLFLELKRILRTVNADELTRREPRNRESVLEELINTLQKKVGGTGGCHTGTEEAVKEDSSSGSETENERLKKSRRERQRRKTVKTLTQTAGLLMGCQDFNDLVAVLQMAVSFLSLFC